MNQSNCAKNKDLDENKKYCKISQFFKTLYQKFFPKKFWLKFFIIFALANTFLRIYFLVIERNNLDLNIINLIKVFFVGLFFDALALGYIAIIPLIYFSLIPRKFFEHPKHQIFLKICYLLLLIIITFSFFSEVIFFDEFQARFNFIAVDYLIYTQEVIGNIFESYPMPLILGFIGLIAISIFYVSYRNFLTVRIQNFKIRLINLVIYLALMTSFFSAIDSNKIDKFFANNFLKEIAWNGIYQLFSAYRNNEIDYEKFYRSIDNQQAINGLRELITKQEVNTKFINLQDIARIINNNTKSKESNFNVMLVVMESFSADFMASFQSTKNLTPNLDKLAKQSLFFTNLKATGTRTVRGLEALTMSIPPTPGNSIIRRTNNENLFTIASPLIRRGYHAKFIYGGDGYFDNMNYFFKNNGFSIVDRPTFKKDEITFNNVWGVADEDLYRKAINEADQSYQQQTPFLNLLLTTSNHRPFTYPDGKIDIPSKTNRDGAVKYADYAIGKFIEIAKTKAWFDNTIFVFIADHCAGSAGNIEVPVWRYQIPALIYAPKIVKPRIYSENASQIDIAPTILGLMNLKYRSKFFGIDLLNNNNKLNEKIRHRSFISTYTDLGYLWKDQLYLLKPKKQQKFYQVELKKYGYNGSQEHAIDDYDNQIVEQQIQYYQVASYLFKKGLLKDFKE